MASDGKIVIDTELDSKGAESGLSKLGSKVGGFASGVGKAVTAATAAGVVAIGNLVKKSVEAYGEYEQLVGGVTKLYGTAGMSLEQYAESIGQSTEQATEKFIQLGKAQTMVFENASEAYKTAGMDMNQYMDLATQFSASLINALGGDTVAAAEKTDIAIRAISDNVNTMGSNVEDVSNAFKGFSKQNYTMLDNLKLGYGGTKTEMERLIKDANEYGKTIGRVNELSIDSFADVVDAIQLIQEKQGIAGTTAKEAATTIQGSLKATQSAWNNLLIAMAEPELDINKWVDIYIASLETFMENVLPVAENALESVAEVINKLAPMIAERLPDLINRVAPLLISAAIQIVNALAQALPSIIGALAKTVFSSSDTFFASLWALFAFKGGSIASAFVKAFQIAPGISKELAKLPGILSAASANISTFATRAGTTISNIPLLFSAVGTKLSGVFTSIGTAVSGLVARVGGLSGVLAALTGPIAIIIMSIAALIGMMVYAYKTNDEFKASVDNLVQTIITSFQPILQQLSELFTNVAQSILPLIQMLISSLLPIITSIVEALTPVITMIISSLIPVFSMIVQFISQILSATAPLIEMVISSIIPFLTLLVNIITMVVQALAPVIELLVSVLVPVISTIISILQPIVDFLSGVLGPIITIVGEWIGLIVSLLTGDFTGAINHVQNIISSFGELFQNIWNGIITFFTTIPGKIWQVICTIVSKVGEFAVSMGKKALEAGQNFFNNLWNALCSIPGRVVEVGRNIVQGIWQGIQNAWHSLVSGLKGLCDGIVGTITGFLGIKSPSKVMADLVGKNIALGIVVGFEDNNPFKQLATDIQNSIGTIQTAVSVDTSSSLQTASNQPVLNFYDVQTSADSIYQKFYHTQTYGLTRSF